MWDGHLYNYESYLWGSSGLCVRPIIVYLVHKRYMSPKHHNLCYLQMKLILFW